MAQPATHCIISAALARTSRRDPAAPVWPRVIHGEPQRHPARQRRPYAPRGHVSAESLALWGVQDPPVDWRNNTPIVQPPRNLRRKRLMAGAMMAAVAGSVATLWPAAEETPSLAAPLPMAAATVLTFTDTPPLRPVTVPSPRRGDPAVADSRLDTFAAPPLTAPSSLDRFVCVTCTGADPRLGGVTVTVQSADLSRQRDTMVQILALGATALPAPSGAIGVAAPQVRFYHSGDAGAARALADRFGAVLVDVTWLSATAPSRIDLLLAADAP
jgi:hypothetical protein